MVNAEQMTSFDFQGDEWSPAIDSATTVAPPVGQAGPVIAPASVTTDVVGKRIAAFVIDFVIAYLGSTIFISAIWSSRPEAWGYSSFFFVVIYKTVLETLMRGETPGKMLLKIMVIRESGEPPGFVAAFARNIFLIPGLLLLCIPSLLMAEFSQKRQRLGDIVARTLVVSNPKSPPQVSAVGTADEAVEPPYGPIHTAAVSITPQRMTVNAEHRSSTDLRALAIGGSIAGAIYVAALAFLTMQWSTGSAQPKDCCFPDVRSSSWIHNDAGIAFAVFLAILALAIFPAIVGFVTQSFAWIPLFGGLTFALMIPAWLIGYEIAGWFYADAMVEAESEGSGYLLMIGLFTVPVIAVFPAALGTIAGRATRWNRDRKVSST